MPHGLEQSIIEFVQHLYEAVGWLGVVIAMAIESACIPLPSEVTMPLAGWFLIEAKGLGWAWTLAAGLYGAIGCTIGSAVAYWVGAVGGRPFILKWGKYVLISPHHVDMADRWFAERGEIMAFVSRLLPVVRTFISFPAGVARMNFPKFLLYSFLGSLPWCWALAYGGFVLGARWEQLREKMRPFDYPIAAIILVLLGLFIWRGIKNRNTPGPVSEAVGDRG
ncbi:MAG TPA: DedA family protein [Thermomicrobiales bacterium]|nr:DedA family protein [Thermomicrobiales bacterium]